MPDLLRREDHGAIARLVLSDASRHNALSAGMIAALRRALNAIADDETIRVVILAAEGRAFCPGHDLRELQALAGEASAVRRLFEECSALMQQIVALPQPVIAEVQAVATAAGCQLVASCDLAVAAERARFGVNGINIGLFCTTPMVALTRAIPPRAAFEMLVTGEFIPAERAHELGLLNRVVPPEQLAEATMELARTIAAKLPTAVRLGKRAFRQLQDRTLEAAYGEAAGIMCANLMDADTAEGIKAFLEKRPPSWA
ncbi:enoyl-CoA hydratase [Paracoccus tibetensis]|uniref:Enoyl-CoA hydratase domain-containing protein 3, mitochondrial n=1 Tax=Paracoccus tibetensis TaxID=336292 RepID=A0A1G5JCC0_9RHOB|nr:enoyl-CoA hydratase [Paracoccus tibetensis]SCY85834.1 Enoyl-CoA hydratase/carnithine racemase [Paracoccus tibetensis]